MSLDVEPDVATVPRWSAPPCNPAAELICLICDVTWTVAGGESCWMCGEHGRRAADAMPWSALAPALFL